MCICTAARFQGLTEVLMKGKLLLGCHAMSTGESLLARNAGSCRPEVFDRFIDKSVAVFQSTWSNISEDLNFRC